MKTGYAIVLLSLCILISGFWIGNALKQNKNNLESNNVEDVLSLPEAANYLGLSEESIKKIINQEEKVLRESGSFSGMRFPYAKVYGHYVFSKTTLDEWLEGNTENHRRYSDNGVEDQ
ncbi:helix-turn-helix domain-containing protein [Neobacillus terrae]|uniref:helix-turn-helix domain-containing protein n=1 Tax=Neobacillus terrae TaxID=3034837 RepID=UPI00140C9348|nr:helix-turn-helix domain-containing protein [Neobacillus terrae]NHM34034.1 helix-turn-helix domain-containing protein [Neobacillus terrae]